MTDDKKQEEFKEVKVVFDKMFPTPTSGIATTPQIWNDIVIPCLIIHENSVRVRHEKEHEKLLQFKAELEGYAVLYPATGKQLNEIWMRVFGGG